MRRKALKEDDQRTAVFDEDTGVMVDVWDVNVGIGVHLCGDTVKMYDGLCVRMEEMLRKSQSKAQVGFS